MRCQKLILAWYSCCKIESIQKNIFLKTKVNSKFERPITNKIILLSLIFKTNHMRYFTALILVFLTIQTYSQSTLIEFNYHDETFKFYKITKRGDMVQTRRPFCYTGVPVKVVVQDLNTFFYDVTFASQSFEEKPVNSEQNIQSLMSGFGNFSGGESDGSGESEDEGWDEFSALLPGGVFQGVTGQQGALGMGAGEFDKEFDFLEDQSVVLDEVNSDLVKASKKIEDVMDFLQLADFTNQELIKLMENPKMTEAEIKKRANDLVVKVIDNTPELDLILTIANAKSNELEKQVGEYQMAYNSFENKTQYMKSSIATLEAKVKNDNFKTSVDVLARQVDNRFKTVSMNHTDLEDILSHDMTGEIRSKLMEMYSNYSNIKDADFKYEYTLNTDQDVTRLTMNFGQPTEDSMQVVKTRYIDIPTQGGLRINSSAGMSFASYFNGQSTFFNDKGTIGEEAGDLFIPTLTTMFHFYRQTYKPFTLGGSFGLSVPVEGEKEFIYMTGLSGIVGKSQRIIFNVGAFGGRINRLNQGLSVGDVLDSEYSEVPLKKVFNFGVYMGLTFNISSFF